MFNRRKINKHLDQLKQWLVKRGYREDHVDSEIERIKLVDRTVSFQIRDKKVDDNVTLALTYHPAMNQMYEILRRSHKHVLKSPRLHSGLPSPPRVPFQNPKTIREKLVRLTVCSYHVTYAFQNEFTLYSCLNVKELLTQNRREI